MESKIDTTLVTRAVIFAAKAHDGAVRKGTKLHYIVHPMEAAAITAGLTDNPEVITAAVLHDTVEDTNTTREQIEAEFGSRVAELVAAESENKREDQKAEDTWEIRKAETIKHLLHCTDRDVKILALADKLSNLRAIYRDYRNFGEDLWDRFNQKDPKMIGWYYRSFAMTCAELYETSAYQEYMELLGKTFCPDPEETASNQVLFCRVHLPILKSILKNPESRRWCLNHSAYDRDTTHPELDRYFRAFISEAYRCGMIPRNYGELLQDLNPDRWIRDPRRLQHFLRKQDGPHILACIAYHFRADHFSEGSLISDSIASGILSQMMAAYLEKAEREA